MMVLMDVCRVRALLFLRPNLPASLEGPPGGFPPGDSPGVADGQSSQNHSSSQVPLDHPLPPQAPFSFLLTHTLRFPLGPAP